MVPSAISPFRRDGRGSPDAYIGGLLAGPFAYKIKKPVSLPFVDYHTLDRRLHFCHEEVRLNRRLALEVYLQVVAIRRDRGGRIRIEGDGDVVEWAVRMRRLPVGATWPNISTR
ncbi:MAG: hypothetical protein U0794_19070 [Isosphaeraceae bacterium]